MQVAVTRTRALAALVAVSAVLASGAASAQSIPADASQLLGLYAGSYLCADGEHGIALSLDAVAPADGGGVAATGRLGIFPVLAGRDGSSAAVAGSFAVSGTIAASGEVTLNPGDWLVRPEGYGAAVLTGTFSQRGDGLWQIVGRPVVPGNDSYCSDLVATRFLP